MKLKTIKNYIRYSTLSYTEIFKRAEKTFKVEYKNNWDSRNGSTFVQVRDKETNHLLIECCHYGNISDFTVYHL